MKKLIKRHQTERVRDLKLADLLEKIPYTLVQGSVEIEITGLAYDSRKVKQGGVFVCISGSLKDAHEFISDVAERGAAVVIVEKEVKAPAELAVVRVENTRYALACMAAAYFGYPAEKLTTIGITGTKGKTTTTYMMKSILESDGRRVGLIGTIEIIIGEKHIHSSHTTPESYELQEYFSQMVEAGLDTVVMEVSSQGLMLNRVSGVTFDYGIFTNLEPDHIGEYEHKDFADYMYCKSLLFRQCKVGIFNADSEHLPDILAGHTCQVETFSCIKQADLWAKDITLFQEGGILGMEYRVSGLIDAKVRINIPGEFSVYNSLAAITLCNHFSISVEKMKEALLHVFVKGRIEMIPVSPDYTMMIDYAHNAMSLESLLSTLREYQPKRLICLFGCGGNRAKSRRYEMGEVSSRMADLTVVTSDNPRFEEPMDIIADIIVGIKKADGAYVTIPDRKEAIAYCIQNAKPGDVVVLAGKGHENYQEIRGVKHPMDERELIAEILAESGKGE